MKPFHPIQGRAAASLARPAFTMIEMLIVITIILIAAGLVVPMLKGNDTTKLRAAAGMVVADLEFAQSESIAHGDALRVFVVNSTTNYTLATAAATGTPITNPVGKGPYSTTFGSERASSLPGVTISSYSLGGDAILGFGLYGQLDQSSNATITLSSGSNSVTITLDPITGVATIGAIN